MRNTNRRTFMLAAIATGSALAGARAFAQAAAVKLSETDPQASALGYKMDSTKADLTKYPKHVATDKCSGCQLYQGKAGDAFGPCQIYPGKLVSSSGWCSAYVKKAA